MNEYSVERPQTIEPTPLPAFSGAILGLQGDVLHGWAMDNAQPELRPIIEVFIDGESVALARADQYEPNARTGDQYHGFAVQLRQQWLDEASLITACIANQSFALDGQLSLPAPLGEDSASIASQVWHTGGLRVSGWCWDPKAPNRHVQVTIKEGDQVVGQALCDQHNQALAYRETSEHGFSIDLPWELADGKVHMLEVIDDSGQKLVGSPIRVYSWPEGLQGLLSKLDDAHQPHVIKLLSEIAKEQNIRLPNSIGWQHYPKWYEVFQRVDNVNLETMQCKVGLLLLSDGDCELENITLQSFCKDMKHLAHQTTASLNDIQPAVEKLISSGCDAILPMYAGDRIALNSLPHFCKLLENGNEWGFVDCDQDGLQGERCNPWLKPAWDIDMFIGAGIYMQGAIFSSNVIKNAMAQLLISDGNILIDWHLMSASLALITERDELRVSRLSKVLYHRAYNSYAGPEYAPASPQRLRAIRWLCKSLAPNTAVEHLDSYPYLLCARWPLPSQLPKVSLIVPTRDQYKLLHTCIEGLLNGTNYYNLEIIVIDNQSSDAQTLNYLSELATSGVRVISHPYPFNYSTINNRAVRYATGEIIGLVNNDIEVIDDGWLKEMVAQLLRPRVGVVGGKLLWPNGMVQHGGVVVGVNGLAAHAGNNLSESDPGYLGINQITRRQSAVTAACLLVRKSVFNQVGGLDENAFPIAFNDVDFCLKVRKLGLDIVWSASAKLIHAESASRGKDQTPEKRARAVREQENFIKKWGGEQCDPYYHPGLSLDYISGPYGGLSTPMTTLT